MLTVGLAMIVAMSCGLVSASAADLEKLKFRFEFLWEEAGEPLKKLQTKYTESLDRLSKKVQAEGNLDQVLQIKSEVKRISGSGSGVAGELFPELARQQGIYEKAAKGLVRKVGEERRKLIETYTDALEKAQTAHTKSGEIEEAVACKTEIKRVEALGEKLAVVAEEAPKTTAILGGKTVSLKAWKTPYGGKLSATETELTLAGPGTGRNLISSAISGAKLSKGSVLRGEFKSIGSWSGFSIGDGKTGLPFLCVFSAADFRNCRIEVHGIAVEKPIEPMKCRWPSGKWAKFELSREDDAFLLVLGREKISVPIPDGIDGTTVGIVAFRGSAISLRELTLGKE